MEALLSIDAVFLRLPVFRRGQRPGDVPDSASVPRDVPSSLRRADVHRFGAAVRHPGGTGVVRTSSGTGLSSAGNRGRAFAADSGCGRCLLAVLRARRAAAAVAFSDIYAADDIRPAD